MRAKKRAALIPSEAPLAYRIFPFDRDRRAAAPSAFFRQRMHKLCAEVIAQSNAPQMRTIPEKVLACFLRRPRAAEIPRKAARGFPLHHLPASRRGPDCKNTGRQTAFAGYTPPCPPCRAATRARRGGFTPCRRRAHLKVPQVPELAVAGNGHIRLTLPTELNNFFDAEQYNRPAPSAVAQPAPLQGRDKTTSASRRWATRCKTVEIPCTFLKDACAPRRPVRTSVKLSSTGKISREKSYSAASASRLFPAARARSPRRPPPPRLQRKAARPQRRARSAETVDDLHSHIRFCRI